MMKKLAFILILFAAFAFVACDTNTIEDPFPSELVEGCYVVTTEIMAAVGQYFEI
jgi:hypothetical protein